MWHWPGRLQPRRAAAAVAAWLVGLASPRMAARPTACLRPMRTPFPQHSFPPTNPSPNQVWHNYSFDRHVMERAGLRMAGFGGDTMHMARLWDSSRMGRGGYSLEALSGEWAGRGNGEEGRGAARHGLAARAPAAGLLPRAAGAWAALWLHLCIRGQHGAAAAAWSGGTLQPSAPVGPFTPPPPLPTTPTGDEVLMGVGGDIRGKVSMKTLFGKANIKKDGTEGKVRGGRREEGPTRLAGQRVHLGRAGGAAVLAPACRRAATGGAKGTGKKGAGVGAASEHGSGRAPAAPAHLPCSCCPPFAAAAAGAAPGGGAAAWAGHSLALGQLLGIRCQGG